MPSREPRRPGETWFDYWQRTTNPSALMHAASGDRDCCRRNGIGSLASTRAHLINDFSGKGHL